MKTLSLFVFIVLSGSSAFAQALSESWVASQGLAAETMDLIFVQGTIRAQAVWTQGPQESKESILRLEWQAASDRSPIECPTEFKVVLWMPSMGHGSAPTKIQPVLDSQGRALLGVYQVSNIYFVMSGDWEVKVTLKWPDGSTETQVLTLQI